VAWSTPWTFFGARFQLLAAWPAVEAGVQRSLSVNPDLNLPGTYFNGMYNPAGFGPPALGLRRAGGVWFLLFGFFFYPTPLGGGGPPRQSPVCAELYRQRLGCNRERHLGHPYLVGDG